MRATCQVADGPNGNPALVMALVTGNVFMPGKGMSFVLYAVVLVVSVASVMMGLDWLATPPTAVPKSVQTVRAPARPAAPRPAEVGKVESAKNAPREVAATTGKANSTTVPETDPMKSAQAKANATDSTAVSTANQSGVAAVAPETAGSAPASAIDNPQAGGADGSPGIIVNEEGVAAQANAPSPRCDVQACSARYHSFTASDCTYQPFDGPRRLCTVGNPPRQVSESPANAQTSDASKPAASSACNYDACGDAYRSFDPATCTYQPYEGPRRQCTK